jgi:lipoate-protein ligase A
MDNNFPKATWRLVLSPPAPGAWNMAVDEAVLEAIGRGESPPTLRLYAWEPACLSLGYTQPCGDADLARLAARGWDLVRRPTGGRAILHTDELTYAVIGPDQEPRLAGSVLESYRRLSAALLAALHLLDLPAEAKASYAEAKASYTEAKALYAEANAFFAPSQASPGDTGQKEPRRRKDPVCFEVPSNYEITAEGKKLIGSAQARRKEGVLQHGSLPLTGDLTRITQVLAFPDEAARAEAAARLLRRATTAEMALGRAPDWDAAARAFIEAFGQTLNLDFQTGELSETERARASELVREKYANPAWTGRH